MRSVARKWVAIASMVAALAIPSSVLAQTDPASDYFDEGATRGSGTGLRVGYLSLGDAIPFTKLVSDGIVEQAAIADLELIVCDSGLSAGRTLVCAQRFADAGVHGVISSQVFEGDVAEICAAYGDVPTLAIGTHQGSCEASFLAADDRLAGFVAGEAAGRHFADEFECEYDSVITLEISGAGTANEERSSGAIAGFSSVCGDVPERKLQRLDIGGSAQIALEQLDDVLKTSPVGGRLVVLSMNDEMAVGAHTAAQEAGREGELFVAAQGADPPSWTEIRCNPQWIADTAYFPERYGHIFPVPAIIDILNGNDVPERLLTPHQAVTADNISDLYDVPACA